MLTRPSQGDRHDRHRPNRNKETSPDELAEEDRALCGRDYLLTFVSIPTLALYGPVRNDPNYIVGPGPDTPVIFGGVLEIIVALACIGTAVALYPVVKRQNEGVAMGFVGARALEAAAIFAGVVSLLSIVTLRQAGAGADALVTGQALVALLRLDARSRTRPPSSRERAAAWLPALPVPPGAPDHSAARVHRSTPAPRFRYRHLFGLMEQVSGPSAIAALPIAVWEFSLGV